MDLVDFKVVSSTTVKASLVVVVLWLVSSTLGFAGQSEPKYTTLVVEYVGEQDRYVFPVVISASSEEGEWYKQHLWPGPRPHLVYVQIVPASVLKEITELPLLKPALESAKAEDDEAKTPRNVSFTACVGHDHVQIMVEAQTGYKILKSIAGVVPKYPTLKSELQEIEDQVKP